MEFSVFFFFGGGGGAFCCPSKHLLRVNELNVWGEFPMSHPDFGGGPCRLFVKKNNVEFSVALSSFCFLPISWQHHKTFPCPYRVTQPVVN